MRWAAQLVSWVALFFAARLLTPGDYGIIAMAMIGIGLVRMVEDFGLDAILVQDRSIDVEQQSQLAGLIFGIGAVLCALFVAAAQLLADFFQEPKVAFAVIGLSLLCLTDALQVLPRALLQRDLAFSKLAIAHFVQTVVAQSALVVAALAGAGYLALVVNSVAGAVAITLLLFIWRPVSLRWPVNFKALARPLKQGWRVLATRVAYYAYNTADQTIIGRFLGKEALGVYSFATTFATLPQQEIGPAVTRVVPGVFSEVQDRQEELRRYFLLLTEFLAYLMLPVSAGMALTADLFVPLFLGDQWHTVVAPLRILCLYVAFFASMSLVSHLMLWTGQFRANMWCTFLTAALLPAAFWFSVDGGLVAIAWTWAIVYPLSNIPPLILGFRTIRINVWVWLAALLPAACACAAMSVAVLALRSALPPATATIGELAVSVAGGALVYCAVLWVVFRSRLLAIVDLVRGRGAARDSARV